MARKIVIPYTPRPEQHTIHDGLEQHRFSVLVCHRRMGKTVCAINHLIKQAVLNTKERPRFAYIAPFYSQAKQIAWDYLKHYTAPIPGVKRNESELWVELSNQARIKLFGADNPDTMRGLYLDGCVIDEVADCKPEIWGEIIRPALSDREGFCVFIGTPKGINIFYELYQNAIRLDSWYADIYPVTRTNIIAPSELEQAKETMSDAQYRQEFLCDFTASSENAFIPLDVVQRAVRADNPPETWNFAPVVLGVDVARFGDDSSVIYVRQGLHSIDIQKYHGIDLMQFADKVVSSIRKFQPEYVFIDSVGIGAGVCDRLRMLGHRNIIDVNAGSKPNGPQFKNRRAEMWADMKEWLEFGGDISDDQVLIADLTGVEYKFDVADRLQLERKEDMRKRGLSSPDVADALALTFFKHNMLIDPTDLANMPERAA